MSLCGLTSSKITAKLQKTKKISKPAQAKRRYAVQATVKSIKLKDYRTLGTVPHHLTKEGIKYQEEVDAKAEYAYFRFSKKATLTEEEFTAKVASLAALELAASAHRTPERLAALNASVPVSKEITAEATAKATAWLARGANGSTFFNRKITVSQLTFDNHASGLTVDFNTTATVIEWFTSIAQAKALLKGGLAAYFTGSKVSAEVESVFLEVYMADLIERVCGASGFNSTKVKLIADVDALRKSGVLPLAFESEFPRENERVSKLLKIASDLHINELNIERIVHSLVQARDSLHRAESRLVAAAATKKSKLTNGTVSNSLLAIVTGEGDAAAALKALVDAKAASQKAVDDNVGLEIFPKEVAAIQEHLATMKSIVDKIPAQLLEAEIARRAVSIEGLTVPAIYESYHTVVPQNLEHADAH